MIGVIAKHSELSTVKEFFELFKTPWESYAPDHRYEFVITTTGELPADPEIGVVAVYDSRCAAVDAELGIVVPATHRGDRLQFEETELPIYGDVSTLRGAAQPFLQRQSESEVVAGEVSDSSRRIFRVGYDLFQEVAILLSKGQPPENAHIPTLEIHISLLRSIMVRAGVPFVEVPPVPAGYDFMACLTHDVDFTGIREHKFDSTMWGFLYRALLGSFIGALKGRLPWSKCWTNWQAAFSLPLVFLGLKEDFWLEFERFMEIEKGLGSTFFFIPFRNHAGMLGAGPAPKRRAAKYDVMENREEIGDLVRNGCEVGLHGVDAWQDSNLARRERARISEITGQTEMGVRMHWLYFDEQSPRKLEEAGLLYDSTFGYNDAIGFRAGTAQVFGIPPANALLELPLSLQDTALFYPDRMNLSEAKAMDCCRHLIRQVVRFGGVLTVNWHTRSLSPERLWGDFYKRFLKEMQEFRVWFATAAQAVNWFRTRRALRFEQVQFSEDGLQFGLQLKTAAPVLDSQPAFVLRVYQPSTPGFVDIPWKGESVLSLVPQEPSRV